MFYDTIIIRGNEHYDNSWERAKYLHLSNLNECDYSSNIDVFKINEFISLEMVHPL